MSLREEKAPKRTKPNYITAILSITLVLLNLGILGAILLMSLNLPNTMKENLEFQLELSNEMSQAEIASFTEKLKKEDFIKSIDFVSKKEAAEIMQKELGENVNEILGYNPLYASLNLKLKSSYTEKEQLEEIKTTLLQSSYVKSINYNEDLLNIINNYAGKLIFPLVAFAVLLLLITLFLIDATIRLSMYSKRFLVRSMKLVGATEWFISKPFLKNGILIGAFSGILASILLLAILFYFLGTSLLANPTNYIILVLVLIALGVLISFFSTQRAVKKYLRLKLDDLY